VKTPILRVGADKNLCNSRSFAVEKSLTKRNSGRVHHWRTSSHPRRETDSDFGPGELILAAKLRWLQRSRLVREQGFGKDQMRTTIRPGAGDSFAMKTKLILMCLAGGLLMSPLLKAEPPVVVVTPGVWETVPEDYNGEYYTYNKHYYYGGTHESGEFESEGQHYKDRYQHEGKWIYGGKWEHHDHKREK
jgi:hypothetical protein